MPKPTDLLPSPFDTLRDVFLGEVAEQVLGKPADEYISDRLVDAGFQPVDSADAEAQYKQTPHQPGTFKLKKVLGKENEDEGGSWDYSLLGIDLHGGWNLEFKTGVLEADPAAQSAQANAFEAVLEVWAHRIATGDAGGVHPVGTRAVLAPAVFVATGPFAARVGDPMVHAGVAAPGPGSPDVRIGGLPALRALDSHVCPAATPIPHGAGIFFSAITDVLINGRPAMRAGDYAQEVLGLNPIVMGCPTVLIGPVAPPVKCTEVRMTPVNLIEWDGKAGVDFGYGIAKVKAGLGVSAEDLLQAHASAEADAAVFRPWFDGYGAVNIPLGIDVDLPWIGRVRRDYLTLDSRAELELRVLTAGANGSLSTAKSQKPKPGFKPVVIGKQKLESNVDLRNL